MLNREDEDIDISTVTIGNKEYTVQELHQRLASLDSRRSRNRCKMRVYNINMPRQRECTVCFADLLESDWGLCKECEELRKSGLMYLFRPSYI